MAKPGRPCSTPGCPRLQPCPEHARQAWQGRASPKPRRMPRGQWEATVAYVIARDRGRCHLCGESGANTADHVLALALGGSDDLRNLAAAHRACNQRKAAREARESRRRRRGAE